MRDIAAGHRPPGAAVHKNRPHRFERGRQSAPHSTRDAVRIPTVPSDDIADILANGVDKRGVHSRRRHRPASGQATGALRPAVRGTCWADWDGRASASFVYCSLARLTAIVQPITNSASNTGATYMPILVLPEVPSSPQIGAPMAFPR